VQKQFLLMDQPSLVAARPQMGWKLSAGRPPDASVFDCDLQADGTRRSLSDAGQFLIGARFTDGSEGVFVGSMAVPEPSALVLSLFAVFLSKRQRILGRKLY
jgi:hypothetical protein